MERGRERGREGEGERGREGGREDRMDQEMEIYGTLKSRKRQRDFSKMKV